MALTQQSSKWARSAPTIRVGVLGLLAAILLVLPLALAPRAEAYIYWTNFSKSGIGRANLNGTGVERQFIQTPGSVNDFAVNDTHIYWTYPGADTIGRARIDGTAVVPDLFRAPGALFCYPRPGGCASASLAVDSDHIYWTSLRGNPPIAGIGRAKLDGTGVDADFVSGISPDPFAPLGSLAVDRDHIYWTNFGPGTIGRAKLDGTAVDETFISGAYAADVAVDRDHIYWTRMIRAERTIGRARIDGTGVELRFITPHEDPGSVAVDDKHVYWNAYHEGGATTISRAKLDGTDVQRAFIDRIQSEGTIAVDGLGPPGKATAKPTQRQTGRKIVLKVKVKARERLTAKASGKVKVNPTYKLRPKKVRLAARQTKTLRLKPKKTAARRIAQALKRGEKAKAKVTVKLTDRAGNRETEKLRVRLKR